MDLAQRKVHQRSSRCVPTVQGTTYHSSCSLHRAGEEQEGQSRVVAREMLAHLVLGALEHGLEDLGVLLGLSLTLSVPRTHC